MLMSGENRKSFKILGKFSFALFLIPLCLFFIVRILAYGNPYRDVLSGAAAVLSVNIIIGVYVLVALRETKQDDRAADAVTKVCHSLHVMGLSKTDSSSCM